jgi:MFS family permease
LIKPERARRRIFFGWQLVAAGFVIQILHSSLLFLSQGAYLIELQAAFGWSRSSISAAFSLLRLESGLLGPLQGWMIDRYGPRPVMRVGALMFGLGFIALGQIHSLWQFYVALAVIAIGSSLGGFLTIHTAIAHWFNRKRARAMSIGSAGFALGALVAPLVAWSMVEYGWRTTAVLSGMLILAIGIPGAQFFKRSPEHYGMLPDGDTPEQSSAPGALHVDDASHRPTTVGEATDFTVREAMRDRSFWLIAIGHSTALLVTATVPVHLVPFLVDQNGWSLAATSFVFPAIMVMQISGQFIGGVLGDLYSKRFVASVAMFGHGGAFIILAFSSSVPAVVTAIVLHGLAWGSRGPLMMAIRADYFGRRNLGVIAGWSNGITITGSVIGPLYAGIMFDWQGDYNVAFWTLGVATLVSTVFFIAARKPPPPVRVVGQP